MRVRCGTPTRAPSRPRYGLDEVEHGTLATLDRTLDFARLFRAVTTSGAPRDVGIGDVQFAAMLRDLATGPVPLVEIADGEQPFGRWRISRTVVGTDVIAGRVDRLALGPLDRWLGGVHLRPGAPLWRWNADRLALVAA